MNEKKVVAVIVEGPSDEAAIGSILKEYFSSDEVQFAVVYGDITSEKDTTANNVVSKVDEIVDRLRSRYGYEWDDFLKIIHLADTDGAFTKNCVIQGETESILYFEDHMEAININAVERRNKQKAENLFKLYSTGRVHTIKYRLYFNSCNLEHVLYDELKDFSDEEKKDMSYDFAERYEGKVSEFISFISEESLAAPGTYRETWRFIEKDKHSLERHSNMHLIFTA